MWYLELGCFSSRKWHKMYNSPLELCNSRLHPNYFSPSQIPIQIPIHPKGLFPPRSAATACPTKPSSKQRKSYRHSVLHRAALAAPSLPPPKNGTLRQAALVCVQRLQAVPNLPVNTQGSKKRPFPYSPSAPSPSNLPPLAQRIRSDIQVGESEVDSPEKEILRSPPSPENSLPPISPCPKGFPSPAPLVFTPMPPKKSSCLNCEAEMKPDHQCDATDSDSSWEDVESDQDPTLDLESEDWAEKFTNSIRSFHGLNH